MLQATELGYLAQRGFHTAKSPVVGSRVHELDGLRGIIETSPAFVEFERGLYGQEENRFLIPEDKQEEAEVLAERKFREYIKKYEASGFSYDNIILWEGLPMFPWATNIHDEHEIF